MENSEVNALIDAFIGYREMLVPIQNDMHEGDGGAYFGKPNNGTDWCFIKKISDKWYYYELHWA